MNEHHLKMYDDKKKTGYRTLVMKEFDSKIQIIFVTGKEDISEEFIHDVTQLEGVVSIWQSVKTETKREVFGDMRFIWGEEKMHLQLEDIQLSLLPRSFFQLNTKQSVNLYNVVKDWMPRSKTTVEAYSGIGAISLFVKDKAEEIVGVESIQDAVDNANENAMLNHVNNVSFICEDAGSALAHLVQEKEVDTLIVDPPRSGLDDTMKETILKSKIKTMIYVSCNPATLAKDLGVLKKEYRIVKIQPVDMFSQTPHVESVTLLVRNDDYKPRRRFDERKNRDYKPRRDGDFKPRRRFDDKKDGDFKPRRRFDDDKPRRRFDDRKDGDYKPRRRFNDDKPRRRFDDRKDGDYKPRRRFNDDRRSKRFTDDKPNRRYGK